MVYLEFLDVSYNQWVDDLIVAKIAALDVKWFYMEDCPKVTSQGLLALIKKNTFSQLKVGNNPQFGVDVVKRLELKFGKRVVQSLIEFNKK